VRHAFRDWEHLGRVVALFAAGILLFLLAQQLLVPPDFGVYGHFRAGALADSGARPLLFAGQKACVECHSDVADSRKAGKHAAVACEACHGPLARHAEDPGLAKATRPDGRAVCLICHTTNVAKPRGFPQVEPAEHADQGACIACHSPHNPGAPPEAKK
jgi:hypothetical protein